MLSVIVLTPVGALLGVVIYCLTVVMWNMVKFAIPFWVSVGNDIVSNLGLVLGSAGVGALLLCVLLVGEVFGRFYRR